MIFPTKPFEQAGLLPTQEVYLEDKKKTLSFPKDTHIDDMKFQVDTKEYGKSPLQSLHEIFANAEPIISDEEWFEMERNAKDLIKAVPEFVGKAVMNIPDEARSTIEKIASGNWDISQEELKRHRDLIDPGFKIANSLVETVFMRMFEPARAFVGASLEGKPRDDAFVDTVRGFVMPSKVEKLTSPERIPLSERELEGNTWDLLPRAVTGAIEDVLLYGGFATKLPALIQNAEVNATKNLMKQSTNQIHKHIMERMNMSHSEAWAYMNKPEVTSQIYYAAKNYMKPSLYSTPLPGKETGKAAIEGVVASAKSPGVLAKAGKDAMSNIPPPEKPTAVSPGGEEIPYKQRQFVKSIQDEMPMLKVSGQYIPRSTDELAQKARNLIKDNIDVAEKMAITGTDDMSIAVGSELLKFYVDEASKATSQSISDTLYDKAASLGNEMAENLTNLGRSVQAASILSRLTPEGQLRFAARSIQRYNDLVDKDTGMFGLKKKIPELTPEQSRYIVEKAKSVAELPEGEGKAIQWKALQDYIADLTPTLLMKKLVSVWKAGLLTGLKTSGLNMMSNYFHAFGTEVLKDIPASAVDKVASLFTGKRAVSFTTKGLPGGAKEGFEKGLRFLKTGYDERNVLSKLDYKRVNFGKGKVARGLEVYTDTVFRTLGSQDQIFYYGAKARSIIDQATVISKNEGLKGIKKTERINELIENPTDDMLILASTDAEVAVFQNKTALAAAGKKIQEIPGAEFVVPFSRTPSAVAMQIINYSPVGAVNTLIRNIGKGKFDQRDFSQGMGRALLGIPVLWLGYSLFDKGNITLDRPTSESERELWNLEGRKPNSIKIGDKWRSVQVLGPAGNLMLIGAHFSSARKSSGSPTEAMAVALAGSAKSFTEQTFLRGLSDVTGAVSDPKRNAEYTTRNFLSSWIPTLVKDLATSIDPKVRRVDGLGDAFLARIPFARHLLEPRVNALGEDVMVQENFFERMLDPSRPITERDSPIVRELRRLEDSGNDIQTTMLGDRGGYDSLTPKQNTELFQVSGRMAFNKVSAFMQMDEYDYLEDDEKAKEINSIIRKSKIVSRAAMVMEVTDGLQGNKLKSRLSEIKKDGLLNRDVFREYEKLR